MSLRVLKRIIKGGAAALCRRTDAFARDTSGGVAAIVAITAPVIIGSMGLGAETSYWMITDQKVQSAADMTAHAVGSQQANGAPAHAMQNIAQFVIGASDMDLTATTVSLKSPPTSGQYAGDPGAVEVVITSSLPRYFSRMYAQEEVQVTARAVAAGVPAGTGCILGLNPTAQGTVSISGSASVTLDGCEIISNSNDSKESFSLVGNGSQTSVDCIRVVGRAENEDGSLFLDCGSIVEGTAPVADPFANVAEPSSVGACNDGKVSDTALVPNEKHPSGVSSMRFCNGLSLKGEVALNPGLYIVEGGDFKINGNTTVKGSGVVIYVRDGKVTWNGSATVTLIPPSSGPYAGLIVFGSRSNTNTFTINGNSSTTLNGALYAPSSTIRILGNNSTAQSSCTQYIGDQISVSGNGTLTINCNNPFSSEIEVSSRVSVVE